jgi:uncharacterized membrane protein YkvI
MKKVLSVAFLLAGTVIGVGFASGREVRSFFAVFGPVSLWFVPLVFLFLFLGCAVFLETGRRFRPESFSDVSRRIWGRGAVLFDFVMVVGNLIFMAGMLAGFDSLGQTLYGIPKNNPVLSIAALLIAAVVVLRGVKGLHKINNILVPAIVIFLIVVCLFSIDAENLSFAVPVTEGGEGKLLLNSVVFVFGNLFSCAGLLYGSGKDMKKRALAAGSLIGAAILSVVLCLFIMAALTASPAIFSADMPVFYLSQLLGGGYVRIAAAVLMFAIFTTLLTNMYNLFDWMRGCIPNKFIAVLVIPAAAFGVRSLGFTVIVDHLYFYVGLFGAVYSLANIGYLIFNRSKLDRWKT